MNGYKLKARIWSRLVIAVSGLITIGVGLWFYGTSSYPTVNHYSLTASQADIPPGKYQAILTLANGKIINLSNAHTGVVIDASELTYYDGSNTNETNQLSQSGTISTPKGGQYRITLPDGTSVWLNAASSLSFSLMSDKMRTRNVELSGEAYFEVAKDSRRPFIVKTARQEVEVLGTHFNISSYADENTAKTTLVNGSLRVINRSSRIESTLRPGQQSTVVKDQLTI
jgi:transmembrane sensor